MDLAALPPTLTPRDNPLDPRFPPSMESGPAEQGRRAGTTGEGLRGVFAARIHASRSCLLYTSDAADDM
eukprot:9250573-Alexandrium_andersonii.AAC.1